MLTQLAIWYLRKKKISVAIGFAFLGGEVRSKAPNSYLYDSTFTRCRFVESDNQPFRVPEGPFQTKRGPVR